jgi:hypothetical protein
MCCGGKTRQKTDKKEEEEEGYQPATDAQQAQYKILLHCIP